MSSGKLVIGLGYGDEGKGITTDYLCKNNPIRPIVVRFSGGQQAGHNVKIGDVSHIHSNFGSGTLRGVPSYFSEHTTIYPRSMYIEHLSFLNEDVSPEVYLHPLSKITTPADVAYNRTIEWQLNHGSCGLGVGATMTRNLTTGYKLYAIDLLYKDIFTEKVNQIHKYYINLCETTQKLKFFNEQFKKEMFLFEQAMGSLRFNIRAYDFLTEYNDIIFEGSQGIMLDMDHGIFPHVTYANTTSKNAIEITKKLGITDIEIYYVTRSYQTRHGNGWMSNEEKLKLIHTKDEINVFNEWQRGFRIGEIDYNLLNYALEIDNLYSQNVNKNLVVTCLDQRLDFDFEYEKLYTKFNTIYNSFSPDSKHFKVIKSKN